MILHDGEYSSVAFLSEEAMRSIGMNVAISGQSLLSPFTHLFMCLHVIGSLTVIGGENGGLIGEKNT